MFLELVDSLRCVKTHEDSWLVARADVMDGRHILRGELGCPICATRYPIVDGVADFAAGASRPRAMPADPEMPLRVAALLGLMEPGGLVVLTGEWSSCAEELLGITEGVQLLALDFDAALRNGGGLSLALTAGVLPLADACARGIALDAPHATAAMVEHAARALIPAGRLIAPASMPVPASLRELARDDTLWVAAKSATTVSAPVSIGVRR